MANRHFQQVCWTNISEFYYLCLHCCGDFLTGLSALTFFPLKSVLHTTLWVVSPEGKSGTFVLKMIRTPYRSSECLAWPGRPPKGEFTYVSFLLHGANSNNPKLPSFLETGMPFSGRVPCQEWSPGLTSWLSMTCSKESYLASWLALTARGYLVHHNPLHQNELLRCCLLCWMGGSPRTSLPLLPHYVPVLGMMPNYRTDYLPSIYLILGSLPRRRAIKVTIMDILPF